MKHYTTIEQSKKLLELGLNPDTSDMIYTMVNGRCTPFIRIETINEVEEDDVLCWSLGALLEVMPKLIDINRVWLTPHSSGYCCTYGSYQGTFHGEDGKTAIDAAFNMVVWLLNQGLALEAPADVYSYKG